MAALPTDREIWTLNELAEFLRVSDEWRFVIFGVLIVLMMVVRPEGIVTRTLVENVIARIVPPRGRGRAGKETA